MPRSSAEANQRPSGEKAESVRQHLTEAQNLGLQGTPSFFVNGRFVSGALSYESLRALIEESPELFEKPRSVVLHGIKLGYQKGKGGIVWDDADRSQVIDVSAQYRP